MKALLGIAALLIAAVLAVLLLRPTPIEPLAWQAPAAPKLEGPYAANDHLKGLQRIALAPAGNSGTAPSQGPEGLALAADGSVYTGLEDGRIVRVSADGVATDVANTGGRPLGLLVDADGSLLIADAERGLLRYREGAGIETVAIAAASGNARGTESLALIFANDLDRAPGAAGASTIYISEASTRFPNGQFVSDLLEHRPHGRLLAHDTATGASTLVADALHFANGVAIGPDGAFVLVAETTAYRISRIWLKGERAGQREVFIDNLPGFPDNLSFNGRDRFWVALGGTRDARLDSLAGYPLLRKMLARLPGRLQGLMLRPQPRRAFVLGFDVDGKLIANLQHAGPDAYAPITSVEEHGPWLYVGSLGETSIARLPLEVAVPGAIPIEPSPSASRHADQPDQPAADASGPLAESGKL